MYFWLNSPELAIARVKARVEAGGHNIAEEVIRRRYKAGIKYFFNDYILQCDRWFLADNSEFPFKVVAQGVKKDIVAIKDPEKFKRIKEIAESDES